MKPVIYIGVILLFPLIPFSSAAPVDDRGEALDVAAYQAMIQDIDVMQRVLEKAFVSRFGAEPELDRGDLAAYFGLKGDDEEENRKSFLSTYTFTPGTLTRARFESPGLYVPGAGAVYVLTVAVPLEEQSAPSHEGADEDLWTETEREIREGAGPERLGEFDRKTWSLNEERIDEVIDLLLETVNRHGSKIEHLGPEEGLTFILRISGESPLFRSGAYDLAIASYMLARSGTDLSRDVIIQVPHSCIDASSRLTYKSPEWRRPIRITQYSGVKRAQARGLTDYFFSSRTR